jgi:hypothetical protein
VKTIIFSIYYFKFIQNSTSSHSKKNTTRHPQPAFSTKPKSKHCSYWLPEANSMLSFDWTSFSLIRFYFCSAMWLVSVPEVALVAPLTVDALLFRLFIYQNRWENCRRWPNLSRTLSFCKKKLWKQQKHRFRYPVSCTATEEK